MTRLVERTEITIREGAEDAFAAAFEATGRELLVSVPGVRSVEFGRGVENPAKFLLLVEWESLAAHGGYRDLPQSTQFRALIGPHAAGATMEHFELA